MAAQQPAVANPVIISLAQLDESSAQLLDTASRSRGAETCMTDPCRPGLSTQVVSVCPHKGHPPRVLTSWTSSCNFGNEVE